MNRWATFLLLSCTVGMLCGCERKAAVPLVPASKTSQPLQSSADMAKQVVDSMMPHLIDLAMTWHRDRDPSRLGETAKLLEWMSLPPELLSLVGAKIGYAYRAGESAVMVGADEEGGVYAVVTDIILDQSTIARQLGQVFEIHEGGSLVEGGLRSTMYTLFLAGEPIGTASIDYSTLESAPMTRVGFISLDRMKKIGMTSSKALWNFVSLIEKAKQGDGPAQVELGDQYASGGFANADLRLAIDYWQMAAEQLNAAGLSRMAVAYYLGLGLERDLKTAIELFAQAAQGGDADAQAVVGAMYSKGDGRPRDLAQAYYWLRRAAAQGHPAGANDLAGLYQRGEGVAQDRAEAITLYRQAAAKGLGIAYVNLGTAHTFGWGVTIDPVQAVKHFEAAANLGFRDGEYALGANYLQGTGVRANPAKAADLFERAARKGHPFAQNNLGLMLARGTGRPRNLIEAAKWWLLASDQGNAEAIENLPEIKSLLTAVQFADAQRAAAAFTAEPDPSANLFSRLQRSR